MTGNLDYVLKVQTKDVEALRDFVLKELKAIFFPGHCSSHYHDCQRFIYHAGRSAHPMHLCCNQWRDLEHRDTGDRKEMEHRLPQGQAPL